MVLIHVITWMPRTEIHLQFDDFDEMCAALVSFNKLHEIKCNTALRGGEKLGVRSIAQQQRGVWASIEVYRGLPQKFG